MLVDAFIHLHRGELGHPDARLHVAGAMTDRRPKRWSARLQGRNFRGGRPQRFRGHRWSPNIDRTGKQDDASSGLTLFSVPATYPEAFGLYVVEALAAGGPAGPARRLVLSRDHRAAAAPAVLVPPGDPKSPSPTAWHQLLGRPGRDSQRCRENARRARRANSIASRPCAIASSPSPSPYWLRRVAHSFGPFTFYFSLPSSLSRSRPRHERARLHSIQRRVEFYETDMAGIVHFSNFFRFMEACEHAFLRSLDHELHGMLDGLETGWPRVNATCDYRAPARFGDIAGPSACSSKRSATARCATGSRSLKATTPWWPRALLARRITSRHQTGSPTQGIEAVPLCHHRLLRQEAIWDQHLLTIDGG